MKQSRVHELAHEFGTSSEAILRMLWGRGFAVRSASSKVDAYAVEWLRFEFTVDQPAPPPPVIPTIPPRRRPFRRKDWDTNTRPFLPIRGQEMWQEYSTPRAPRRSMRSVALFGSRPAETASLDVALIEQGLNGSPYSLPEKQYEYLSTSFLPRVAALSIRAARELEKIASSRRAMLRRMSRSSEIFESNKIEGLGVLTTDVRYGVPAGR